jgi:hypothetical protein
MYFYKEIINWASALYCTKKKKLMPDEFFKEFYIKELITNGK